MGHSPSNDCHTCEGTELYLRDAGTNSNMRGNGFCHYIWRRAIQNNKKVFLSTENNVSCIC